jgi:hypothetical protein
MCNVRIISTFTIFIYQVFGRLINIKHYEAHLHYLITNTPNTPLQIFKNYDSNLILFNHYTLTFNILFEPYPIKELKIKTVIILFRSRKSRIWP